GRRRRRDVGGGRARDRRAAGLGEARGVEVAHRGHPAGPAGDAGRRGRRRRLPRGAGLRLHDGAGDQGRRRHGDGGLSAVLAPRDRATMLTYAVLLLVTAAAWASMLWSPMGADEMAGTGMVMAPSVGRSASCWATGARAGAAPWPWDGRTRSTASAVAGR